MLSQKATSLNIVFLLFVHKLRQPILGDFQTCKPSKIQQLANYRLWFNKFGLPISLKLGVKKFGPSKFLPGQILDRASHGNIVISLTKTPPTPTRRRLLVIPFRKYMTSLSLGTLHEGPVTDLMTVRGRCWRCSRI